MSFERSSFQGYSSSKSFRRISNYNNSSIVQKRISRSIAALPLHISVHQHYGYRVHLNWFCTQDAERFIQRMFPWGIDCFCEELTDGGARGLCECVCDVVPEFLEDNLEPCFREFPTPEDYVTPPNSSMLRSIPECNPFWYHCICPISSSECLDEWKRVTYRNKLSRFNYPTSFGTVTYVSASLYTHIVFSLLYRPIQYVPFDV
jgi:hypothetical protein